MSELEESVDVMLRRIAAQVATKRAPLAAAADPDIVELKRRINSLSDDELMPILGIINAMVNHTPRRPRSKKKRALKKWQKRCSAAWKDSKNRKIRRPG